MKPRSKSRVPVNYRVSFSGDKGTGKGVLTDLAIGGGQIETDVRFDVGEHLRLQVELSGAREPIVIELAVIRWKEKDRFGLEFIRFEAQTKQHLQDMLNQRDG